MKTGAALVLSVVGILAAGSAALAVNTQVLSVSPTGTGNANSVLLPNAPVPPASATTPAPKPTAAPASSQKASIPAKSAPAKSGPAKADVAKASPAKSVAAPSPANAGSVATARSSSGPGGDRGWCGDSSARPCPGWRGPRPTGRRQGRAAERHRSPVTTAAATAPTTEPGLPSAFPAPALLLPMCAPLPTGAPRFVGGCLPGRRSV